MALLLISLNFQRIIACSKKYIKSLWIHELLSTGFSPCLLLIPGEQPQHNSPGNSLSLTAGMPGAPTHSAFLSEPQGLDQLWLSENGNQVPVWINPQSSTSVLCLSGEICVCTQKKGTVRMCGTKRPFERKQE